MQNVLLTDGAYGTALPPRDYVELWNLDRPDLVEAVHRSYIEAGSQIILTNTFRAPNADSIRAGVEIARRAAAGRALVYGSTRPGSIYEAFYGVDALVLETMTDLHEARTAVAAAGRAGVPVIASFFFGAGLAPEAVVDVGADVIGTNCGAGPEHAAEICRRLRAASDLPIWLKPSPGLPGRVLAPEAFAGYMPEWIDAGATYIGGCCGTTAAHIRAMSIKCS